jgi:hypothetical protein
MTDDLNLVGLRFKTRKPMKTKQLGREYDAGLIGLRYADPSCARYSILVYRNGDHVDSFDCVFPREFDRTEWAFYTPGHQEFN